MLNAATWQREAAVQVARAVRSREGACAVMLADLDHFKVINDTFGHQAGNDVLKAVADTFRAQLREYDLSGRYGGEEYAILLPDITAAEAAETARRLCAAVSRLTIPAAAAPGTGLAGRVTVSIGVAALDGSHHDLDELIAAADHALYEAKNAGRNTVRMISG